MSPAFPNRRSAHTSPTRKRGGVSAVRRSTSTPPRLRVGLVLSIASLFAVALLTFCSSVSAAEGRLPPVTASGYPSTSRPSGFHSDLYEQGVQVQSYDQSGGGSVYPADEMEPMFDAPPEEGPVVPQGGRSLPGARDGIFQGGNIGVTWLAGSDLQMVDVLAQASFGLPFPSREAPVVFTPGYGLHALDGPVGLDVPGELHDAWLEARFPRQLSERLLLDIAVAPGYYSDFERRSDNALRITGRAVAIYNWTPTTKLALGVVYLDRNDVTVLPAAGITWQPSPDRRIELIFPRPRFAFRTYRFEALDRTGAEWWYYIAGEFGGGTWSTVRADDTLDELTYHDYRVVFGLERKPTGLNPSRIETAYVFGRALEYASDEQEFEVDDTLFARLVWGF